MIELERIHFLGFLSNRRQPVPFHVAALMIVIVNELALEIVQVPLAENYEFRNASNLIV